MIQSLQAFFTSAPVPGPHMAASLWLIIALPLIGAFICGVFGRTLGRHNVGLVASATVAGSFLLSILAFWTINDPLVQTTSPVGQRLHWVIAHDLGTWFAAGTFRVNFGLQVDHLTGVMLLVITGVGFLIHLYSTSYMEHDDGYWRFFAYLNLFVAMMLTLVLADNLILLFVGWEGVGMCSYLLIGFWYSDPAKAWAGRKAFITNRVGDFGFLVGAFLLVMLVGSFRLELSPKGPATGASWEAAVAKVGPLNFQVLERMSTALPNAEVLSQTISQGPLAGFTYGGVITAILLLFLLGASGKSAQLPLYVWLPDAMAGPTPVSALIHAATMVTAGVYLFTRLSFLLVLSPVAMATVALVGAFTALLAALIAFAQNDIKKVLAYSTVSQLGFMFMGVGMGVFWAAVLHLVTHAFFKACLFLGAGSVMHGNDDETDIKKLGGLRKQMPWTWITFAVSTVAITGVLPLSGFFSKDAILHGVHSTAFAAFPWVNKVVWVVGLATACATAFYMTRLYVLTFEGQRSPVAKIPKAHESAPAMTLPLVVLAFLAIVAAAWGIPLMPGRDGHSEPVMQNFLSSTLGTTLSNFERAHTVDIHHSSPWGAWILAAVIAWIGAGSAVFMYMRFFPAWGDKPAPALARALRALAENKFYVDELYDLLLLRPLRRLSNGLFKVVDAALIDTAAVRGTPWVVARVASLLRYFQTGDAQSYATVMALALAGGIAFALFAVIK
ncbi:MAG: NADH-quinone oxidoreductase subunit L [Myxococcaceae bacterium]